MIVRLFEDIANDTAGSAELAHRFLGFRSSTEVVIVMILISFMMLVLLGITVAADAYVHVNEGRMRKKWSVWYAPRT
jgi:hypothetical protein